MSVKNVRNQTASAKSNISGGGGGGSSAPIIANVIYTDSSYNALDDTAISLAGGYVKLTGSGFGANVSLSLNGSNVSPVTVVSSSEIRAQFPAVAVGTYSLMLFNTDTNIGSIKPDSVAYSIFPSISSVAFFLVQDVYISQQLGVSGDSPFVFTVTSGTLPTGLSLSSSGLLTGTITGYNANTTLEVTVSVDDPQNQTITQVITMSVTVSDASFIYNTLLLSGDSVTSFVSDNSINNAQLTVVGDTRATNFNPYQLGYYSNYFNGSSDNLTVPDSVAFDFTGDFTMEAWVYPNSLTGNNNIVSQWTSGLNFIFKVVSSGRPYFAAYPGGTVVTQGTTTAVTAGKWNHVAVTRSGTTIRLFVNGVLDSTAGTVSGTISEAAPVYIGSLGASEYWNGYISNLRIVKGTALYTTSFTPNTTPLTVVTGTSLLTCQTSGLVDGSANNFTITKGGATTVSPTHPFPTVYRAESQYYSTSFNGSSDYLSVSSVFELGTSNWTIEGWFYVRALPSTGNQGIIFANSFDSTNLQLFITDAGAIQWQAYTINSQTYAITLGKWTHFALSNTDTNVKFFVDGVLKETYTGFNKNVGSTAFYIGARGAALYFNGNISNLRFVTGAGMYNADFTPSTSPLTAIANTTLLTCQDSTIKDNSTNSRTITSVSTAKPVAVSPFTPSSYTNTEITTYGSGYLDGTGDYLSMPNSSAFQFGTGDFTVEFWWYLTTTFSSIEGPGIGQKASDSTNGWVIYRNHGSNTDKIAIRIGSANTDYFTTVVPKVNCWQHWAVVRSGTTLTWYCDGVACGTSTGVSGNATDTSGLMYVGYAQTWSYTTGASYFSDVRVTKSALYSSNFAPQFTSPLSNLTNTTLLTLQTNSSHNNNVFKDNSRLTNLVTRSGNVTNGTLSPYGDNWSMYLNGSTDYPGYIVNTTSSLNFALGQDFTLECWVFSTKTSAAYTLINFGTYKEAYPSEAVIWITNTNASIFISGGSDYPTQYTCTYPGSATLPRNTWTHVALVRQSNNLKLYLNGVGGTAVSAPGAALPYSSRYDLASSNGFWYGVDQTNWTGFTPTVFRGYLSNVRYVVGTAVYTANFTPPISPLTAIPGTQVLGAQNPRLALDSSINNWAPTINGTPSVQKFSPFGSVTVPKYYSTYFPATGTYLIGSNSNFAIGALATVFTFEFWVYPVTSGVIFSIGTGSSYGNQIYVDWGRATANKFTMGQNNGSSSPSISITSAVTYAANSWYHVAITKDASGVRKMFINGALAGTQTDNTNSYGTATSLLFNGLQDNNGTGNGGGSFYISNFRLVTTNLVYNTTFTPSTSPLTAIANTQLLMFNGSTNNDSSLNAVTFTQTGSPKVIAVSPFTPSSIGARSYSPTLFSGSMYFDGTGDYLQATYSAGIFDIPANTPVTVEAWVYTTSTSTFIIANRNWSWGSSGPTWGFILNNGVTPQWAIAGTGSATYVMAVSTISGTLGQWNHYAFTRDSSNVVRIFVNGVLGVSRTDSQAMTNSSGNVYFGSPSNTAAYSTGYISDFSFLPGVSLYNSNFYPGSTPLTPATTIGTTTYTPTLLLNGASGGVIDASRTVDLETVGEMKVTNFSPYNGSYYSAAFSSTGIGASLTYSGGGTGDITHELWIKPENTSRFWAFCPANGSNGIGISTESGYLNFWHNYFGAAGYTSNSTVPTGTWTHIAIVRKSTTIYFYINGVRQTNTVDNSTIPWQAAGTVGFGYYPNNNTQYNVGSVSNMRIVDGTAIYDTTQSTITVPTSPLTAIANTKLLVFQSNKFIDNSSSNFTISNTNASIKTANPFQVNSGQSYYFDGTGDYAVTPATYSMSSLWLGNMTMECWVYFNSIANSPHIFNIGESGSVRCTLYVSSSVFKFYTTVSTGGDRITSSTTLMPGQWYHVAITKSSGTFTLWLDGVSQGTSTTTVYPDGPAETVALGYQNYSGGSGDYLNGYMSDVRITNGSARYTTTFTPPSALMLKV